VAGETVAETIASARARRKRAKRRKTIIIMCIVVVVAVGAYLAYHFLTGSSTPEVTYTTQAAAKITILQSVSGTGSVNLTSSESVTAEISGTVEVIKVAEGDSVKKGQVLLTMSNDTLKTAVEQAQNSCDQAKNTLTSAGLSLEKAQKNLESLLDEYQSERWNSTGYSAHGTGFVQASFNVTPPSSTTTTTQRTTTSTTAQPSTTSSTISDLDIALAQQQVTSAQLAVQVAQTNVTLAQMSLDDAKDNLGSLEVTAPIDGTVTKVNAEEGDELGTSGGTGSTATGSSSAVVVVTDLTKWDVTVTLAESDVGSVKVGQKATLTFDALPDVSITGKVASMDTTGTNSSGVVSYTATINPDVGNEAILGGMTVTVDIITLAVADVIGVPSSAVKTSTDGTSYVEVMGTDGVPVQTTVEVGASDDTYTEITSGLTEGQEIVTATVTADSTATTTRNGGSGGLLDSGGGLPSGGAFPGGGAPPGQ
jgi:RND family efflux transporter MFP subunit